jgi:1-acyl-sn-glycerol-3-phosphate acyltransferase
VIALSFLRTIAGWAIVLFATIFFALLIGLSGETAFSEKCLRVWSHLFLFLAGARLRCRIDPAIEAGKSYVYVSNHTSNLDVPAILAAADHPLRFIAKKELRRIPLFGWAAKRMGHVFIDRKDSHGSAQAIRERIQRGLAGVSLFFFAEGTRSTTREMLPFKKGAAIAAIETGLECVPIAVAGAREVMKPKGFSLFRPGPVAVVFGPPVSIASYTIEERTALVAAQRAAVESALAIAEGLLNDNRIGEPPK